MSKVYSATISGHEVLFLFGFFEVIEWPTIPYTEEKVLFRSTSAKEVAVWCFNNPKLLPSKISYSDHSWFAEDFEGLNFDDV